MKHYFSTSTYVTATETQNTRKADQNETLNSLVITRKAHPKRRRIARYAAITLQLGRRRVTNQCCVNQILIKILGIYLVLGDSLF